jgi:DNA replication ATP-dependent helicase Dna2
VRISSKPLIVVVRGDWLACRFAEDSIINIIANAKSASLIIDDDQNYLVTEPDVLISTTVLADSFACLRRSVLSYRTQPSVEDNKPSASLICGSIVHGLVEEAFKTGQFADFKTVTEPLAKMLTGQLEKIFCCDKDEVFVKENVEEAIKSFPEWCKLYLRKIPAAHAYVHDQVKASVFNGQGKAPAVKQTISLSKIIDLEENIWSTSFGIKGKVDATVVMKYKPQGRDYTRAIVPFELKTGNSTTSVAHRAQTLLYTLLLNDRYRRPIDHGLLFYISTGDLIRIPGWRDEIRSIMIARNRLAEELALPDALPAQIRNEHLCKRCFQLDSCMMYHRLVENGTDATASAPKSFEMKTAHLPEDITECQSFFRKWHQLITLEEKETLLNRSELWTLDVSERTRLGRCFSSMALVACDPVAEDELSNGTMAKFRCVFKKATGLANSSNGLIDTSSLNVQMSEGDPVVVSRQDPPVQYGLAIGFVQSISPSTLVIHTDRFIKRIPGPEESIDDGDIAASFGQLKIEDTNNKCLYSIDRDELASGFGLLRANVYKLFSAESSKLMELIVSRREPQFGSIDTDVLFDPMKLKQHGLLQDFRGLDEYQQAAFKKVIETLDYLLILGMPGTGKTTTLAFIIRYLVQVLGRSVLVSSHTHSAIDHIALKLQEKNVKLVRIGNSDRIDKHIAADSLLGNQKFQTVAEVEHYYASAQVVVCTSLGINQ